MTTTPPPRDTPIYGIHPVEELLATRRQDVEHVYFDKDKKNAQLFNLLRICRRDRMSYNLVPAEKINALAQTQRHQGVVAFCSVRSYNNIDDVEKIVTNKLAQNKNPLIVIPASVEDVGNLGAVIRTCVCLGVDALLLERKNTVPLNATVAKTSAGMLEHLCVAKPRNLEGLIGDYVERYNFNVVGAAMNGGVKPDEVNFSRPTFLITGGEHKGIPPYLQKLCTQTVSIPMSQTDAQNPSFNASVAAAILIYECARQKKFA